MIDSNGNYLPPWGPIGTYPMPPSSTFPTFRQPETPPFKLWEPPKLSHDTGRADPLAPSGTPDWLRAGGAAQQK